MNNKDSAVSKTLQWKITGRNKADSTPSAGSIIIGNLYLYVYISAQSNEWQVDLSDGVCVVPIFQKSLSGCKTIEEAIVEAQVAAAKYLASLSVALGSIPLTVLQ